MIFSLKRIDEEDLEFVMTIRSDPELYPYLGTYVSLNKKSQLRWFEKLQTDNSQMYFVLMLNHEKIGYVRITQIDMINRTMCVGGDIHKKCRGNGYAKEMYNLIFDLGFKKLNMNRLWLFVLENNDRAIHIYKKLGFIEEGRQRKAIYNNGKYYDYIMMSILREEYDSVI